MKIHEHLHFFNHSTKVLDRTFTALCGKRNALHIYIVCTFLIATYHLKSAAVNSEILGIATII